MPGFVADALVTLRWCLEEEATPAREALLERRVWRFKDSRAGKESGTENVR